MPVTRPYFNLHQILTGLYTPGEEFIIGDGTDYIGQYHALPTGQYFSGPRPEDTSVEILRKKISVTDDALIYRNTKKQKEPQSEVPISIEPRPTDDDYNSGNMVRYFVQKRNSPLNTIVEIDSVQFNKINTVGNPGINGNLWAKLRIEWKISKLPSAAARNRNMNTLIIANQVFPGISSFLKNTLEFYR